MKILRLIHVNATNFTGQFIAWLTWRKKTRTCHDLNLIVWLADHQDKWNSIPCIIFNCICWGNSQPKGFVLCFNEIYSYIRVLTQYSRVQWENTYFLWGSLISRNVKISYLNSLNLICQTYHSSAVGEYLLAGSSSHSINAKGPHFYWNKIHERSRGHYVDVIMTTMASQITSFTVVYSAVYSDADQSNHQSSASLPFVWGIHRDRWIPRTKGQLRGKCFHLMTSSWTRICCLLSVVYLLHRVSGIFVKTGSGNGLLPGGAKSLPEPRHGQPET